MAGVTKLPFGQRPLMLYNGEVSCQTLTGKISIVRLNTHNFHDDQELSEEEVCLCEWGVVCKLFNPFWKFLIFCGHGLGGLWFFPGPRFSWLRSEFLLFFLFFFLFFYIMISIFSLSIFPCGCD